jgi:hypothetical protein
MMCNSDRVAFVFTGQLSVAIGERFGLIGISPFSNQAAFAGTIVDDSVPANLKIALIATSGLTTDYPESV